MKTTECFFQLSRGEGLFDLRDFFARELIATFVSLVTGMPLEPLPLYTVPLRGGVQRAPQRFVSHRLFFPRSPAVRLPPVNPRFDALFDVFRIGMELDLARFLQGIQRL